MLLDVIEHWQGERRVIVLEEGEFPDRVRELGVQTDVVPLRSAASKVKKEASILRGLTAIPDVWRCGRKIAALTVGCDVLYANTQKALVVAAIAARMNRCPLLFHLHDLITSSHFSNANRRVAVFLMSHAADALVANSQASASALIASGGKPKFMSVVYNGFNQPTRDSRPANLDALKARPLTMGLFGRIAAWKGQQTAIEAMAKPALRDTDARLMIVGQAMYGEEDERYLQLLRMRVEELELADRVEFMGHRDDVPELMHQCDVILHTSIAPEPFGRVIVEGMLAGKPVVATDAGGVSEIIDHEVDGILVPPGDADSLAVAVERLRDDPDFRARLAKAGRQKAIAKFSIKQMMDGVDAVIENVLAKRKARS